MVYAEEGGTTVDQFQEDESRTCSKVLKQLQGYEESGYHVDEAVAGLAEAGWASFLKSAGSRWIANHGGRWAPTPWTQCVTH